MPGSDDPRGFSQAPFDAKRHMSERLPLPDRAKLRLVNRDAAAFVESHAYWLEMRELFAVKAVRRAAAQIGPGSDPNKVVAAFCSLPGHLRSAALCDEIVGHLAGRYDLAPQNQWWTKRYKLPAKGWLRKLLECLPPADLNTNSFERVIRLAFGAGPESDRPLADTIVSALDQPALSARSILLVELAHAAGVMSVDVAPLTFELFAAIARQAPHMAGRVVEAQAIAFRSLSPELRTPEKFDALELFNQGPEHASVASAEGVNAFRALRPEHRTPARCQQALKHTNGLLLPSDQMKWFLEAISALAAHYLPGELLEHARGALPAPMRFWDAQARAVMFAALPQHLRSPEFHDELGSAEIPLSVRLKLLGALAPEHRGDRLKRLLAHAAAPRQPFLLDYQALLMEFAASPPELRTWSTYHALFLGPFVEPQEDPGAPRPRPHEMLSVRLEGFKHLVDKDRTSLHLKWALAVPYGLSIGPRSIPVRSRLADRVLEQELPRAFAQLQDTERTPEIWRSLRVLHWPGGLEPGDPEAAQSLRCANVEAFCAYAEPRRSPELFDSLMLEVAQAAAPGQSVDSLQDPGSSEHILLARAFAALDARHRTIERHDQLVKVLGADVEALAVACAALPVQLPYAPYDPHADSSLAPLQQTATDRAGQPAPLQPPPHPTADSASPSAGFP